MLAGATADDGQVGAYLSALRLALMPDTALATTLFVVDDEPATRRNAAQVAQNLGISCQAFASAEDVLSAYTPCWSGCLLTDFNLPGINGLELLESLRPLGGLPVVFISSCATISTAVAAMRSGAVDVLEKPCPADRLTEAVERALAAGREMQRTHHELADLQRRYEQLEPREQAVLVMIVDGRPNKVIARDLGVCQRTAARVRADVFEKMGVESAVELAHLAARLRSADRAAASGLTRILRCDPAQPFVSDRT